MVVFHVVSLYQGVHADFRHRVEKFGFLHEGGHEGQAYQKVAEDPVEGEGQQQKNDKRASDSFVFFGLCFACLFICRNHSFSIA